MSWAEIKKAINSDFVNEPLDAKINSLRPQLKEAGEAITLGDLVGINILDDKVYLPKKGVNQVSSAPVTFNSTTPENFESCQVSDDKTIICYKDSSLSILARIITTAGSIVYGSESIVDVSNTPFLSICMVDADKALIFYRDSANSEYGTVCVLTISGTTITAGTPVAINTKQISHGSICKIDTNKALLAYRNDVDTQGEMVVVSVSGTVPSVGNIVEFNPVSGDSQYCSLDQLDTDKAILCYRDLSFGGYGVAQVITVSGDTPTPNAKTTFESADTVFEDVVKMDTGICIVAYRDSANSSYGTACILTISGTIVTAGTPVVFESGNMFNSVDICKIDDSRAYVVYGNGANSSYATGQVLGLNSNNITPNTSFVLRTASALYTACSKASTNKTVSMFKGGTTSGQISTQDFDQKISIEGYTITPSSVDPNDSITKVGYIPF